MNKESQMVCPFCHQTVVPTIQHATQTVNIAHIDCDVDMEWKQCPNCQTSLSNPLPSHALLRRMYLEEREQGKDETE